MQKIKNIIILSLLVAILPFTGFPVVFKNWTFFLLGALIFIISILLKSEVSGGEGFFDKTLVQKKDEEPLKNEDIVKEEESNIENEGQGENLTPSNRMKGDNNLDDKEEKQQEEEYKI